MRIEIADHLGGLNDQSEILYLGRRVAYCGRPGGPVRPICFLPDGMTRITEEQKLEIVAFIREQVGEPKPTAQTQSLLDQGGKPDVEDANDGGHSKLRKRRDNRSG